MTTTEWLETTLRERFAPEHLEIIDESALHAGHAGAASGGGHYRVVIVAQAFVHHDLVSRQRQVYDALGPAMRGRVHALALRTLTPTEYAARRAESPPARG